MHKPRFLEGTNGKYFAIALCYFLACVFLYIIGALYIQIMLLLATMALFPAILVHESSLRNKAIPNGNPTLDERWSKTKMELDKVQDNISKTKDPQQKKTLQRQQIFLENELRRLEWKVRESDLNRMYNASRANLKELPDLKAVREGEPIEEKVREWKSNLSEMIGEVRKIAEREPVASQQAALVPITNSVRAHYNMMRKIPPDEGLKSVQSDYFAVWGALSSFISGVRVNPYLAKYASPKFQKRFLALLQLLESSQDSLGIAREDPRQDNDEEMYYASELGKGKQVSDGV